MSDLSIYNPNSIRARTAEAREAGAVPAAPETREQKRLRVIAETIRDNDFGCAKESVRALVTAMVGELPEVGELNDRPFTVGSVIASGRRRYLVRALDSDGDARVLSTDGGTILPSGNDYVLSASAWRPATENEVERFLREAKLI